MVTKQRLVQKTVATYRDANRITPFSAATATQIDTAVPMIMLMIFNTNSQLSLSFRPSTEVSISGELGRNIIMALARPALADTP